MLFTALLIAAVLGVPETPDTLEVATVTDTRSLAVSASAPGRSVAAARLEKTGATMLHEALKGFAGVNIKDYGGIGGLKTVSIRNFGSAHTGIIYDGITVSDAQNGTVDIGRFDLEGLESLKVEISASDDIFRNARSNASVGTLTINSSMPDFSDSPTKITARMRFASFATFNPYLRISQKIGKGWSAVASADYLNSRGNYPFLNKNGDFVSEKIRENSDIESIRANIDVYGCFGSHGELRIKASYFDSERGLPGSVVLYTDNPVERLWDRDGLLSAIYTVNPDPRWKIRAGLSYSAKWNRYTNEDKAYPEPVDDRYLSQEAAVTGTAMWTPITPLSVSIAEDFTVSHLDSDIKDCAFPTRESSYTSLSAKYGTERLTAVAGLLLTFVREQTKVGDPSPGRSHLSPSGSVSFRLLEETDFRIRASFKESYRIPTFNEIYYPRTGSISLSPERAYQTNLGLSFGKNIGEHHISASADGYYNIIKDKIVAVPTMFIWRMRNVGKVEMAGCDITAGYSGRLAAWLALKADLGYSYQYAVDITDPEAKNYRDQIAYTPRNCASGSIALETKWINVGYSLHAVGERYSLAQNILSHRLEPYEDHSISLNGSYEIGKRHKWVLGFSAEALNLGNENYEIIQYYPMAGRNYRLTIKITY